MLHPDYASHTANLLSTAIDQSLYVTVQITALAFSPDGQTLASGSEDGSMMAWDLKEARRSGLAPSHKGPVWSLAFSQGDGAILASGKLFSLSSNHNSFTQDRALFCDIYCVQHE